MQELTSRNTTSYLLFILFLTSLILSIPFIQLLGDDTFIYMRAINRFLGSGRLEYNFGEPCYLTTSITWFIAWANMTALLKDIDIARYILSFLMHIVAFVTILPLARRLIKNRLVLLVTLATIFLDPFYLRWFWGGWEVSAKIAAAALCILVLLKIKSSSSRKMFFFAGLCAGLAALTRPEMIVLAFLGLVFLAIKYPKKAWFTAYYFLGVLLVTLPWMVYAYKTFGWVVPHTIFAKTVRMPIFLYLSIHGIKFVQIMLIPLSGLLLLVGVSFFKSFEIRTSRNLFERKSSNKFFVNREELIDFLLITIWGCAAIGYVIKGSFIGSIYTTLFAPFWALILGSIIDRTIRVGNSNWMSNKTTVTFVVLILLISVGIQLKLYYRFSIFNTKFRLGADIEFIEFALKVKDLTQPSDIIGLWEIGVIGYYSDRYIIDFVGLGTPEIVEYQMKYKEGYIEKFLEDSGKIPGFIIKDYGKGYDEGKTISREIFFGYSYEPIYSRKIVRAGGGTPKGHYSLYVLYRKIL
jgi:hypothetical protein